MKIERSYGMDGEKIYPYWECPECDAPNAGVEQCNPRLGAVRCDECGTVMVYAAPAGGAA